MVSGLCFFRHCYVPQVVSYPSGKRKFSFTSPASDKTTAENSYSLQCCQSEKKYKDINIDENSFLSGIHCDCCSSLLFLQCWFTLFSHCIVYSLGNALEKFSIVFYFSLWRKNQIYSRMSLHHASGTGSWCSCNLCLSSSSSPCILLQRATRFPGFSVIFSTPAPFYCFTARGPATFARKLPFNTNADFLGINGSPDPCCRCFTPHSTWPLQAYSPITELPCAQAVRGGHLDTSSDFSSITG